MSPPPEERRARKGVRGLGPQAGSARPVICCTLANRSANNAPSAAASATHGRRRVVLRAGALSGWWGELGARWAGCGRHTAASGRRRDVR